jgi:hypothetical protein
LGLRRRNGERQSQPEKAGRGQAEKTAAGG